jgi:hypothetical protein
MIYAAYGPFLGTLKGALRGGVFMGRYDRLFMGVFPVHFVSLFFFRYFSGKNYFPDLFSRASLFPSEDIIVYGRLYCYP